MLITGIGVGIDLIIPQIELANILDDNKVNRLSQIFTSLFSIIKKAAIGLAGGIALTGYGYLEKIDFSRPVGEFKQEYVVLNTVRY